MTAADRGGGRGRGGHGRREGRFTSDRVAGQAARRRLPIDFRSRPGSHGGALLPRLHGPEFALNQITQFGPYKLMDRISVGGMAEVYKAVELPFPAAANRRSFP